MNQIVLSALTGRTDVMLFFFFYDIENIAVFIYSILYLSVYKLYMIILMREKFLSCYFLLIYDHVLELRLLFPLSRLRGEGILLFICSVP